MTLKTDTTLTNRHAHTHKQVRSHREAFGSSGPKLFLYPPNFVVPTLFYTVYFKHI